MPAPTNPVGDLFDDVPGDVLGDTFDELFDNPFDGPDQERYDYADDFFDPAEPSPFGLTIDAETGEIIDEVAIARALDGHRVDLTPVEQVELLRRAMAKGHTDAEAAALLRVSKRTIARRRRDAGIVTSGTQYARRSA